MNERKVLVTLIRKSKEAFKELPPDLKRDFARYLFEDGFNKIELTFAFSHRYKDLDSMEWKFKNKFIMELLLAAFLANPKKLLELLNDEEKKVLAGIISVVYLLRIYHLSNFTDIYPPDDERLHPILKLTKRFPGNLCYEVGYLMGSYPSNVFDYLKRYSFIIKTKNLSKYAHTDGYVFNFNLPSDKHKYKSLFDGFIDAAKNKKPSPKAVRFAILFLNEYLQENFDKIDITSEFLQKVMAKSCVSTF